MSRLFSLLLGLGVLLVFPISASAAVPKFGLSTENPAIFRQVQATIPTAYWAPFIAWGHANPMTVVLEQTQSFHATPVISWEPRDAVHPGRNRLYSNTAIIKGKQDAYIKASAKAIKRYRKPVYLRLAHEMNGPWYPWHIGNYVGMWKHVVRIFRKQHVRNAKFLWSPNPNTFQTDTQFDHTVLKYYPGGTWVDGVGTTLTRFGNQGSCYSNAAWFFQRFDRLVILKRPTWITEATVDLEEVGMWMPQFREEIDARPWIKGVIWLSTRSGKANDPRGTMNWMLSDNPFAMSYLRFQAGYTAPKPTLPRTALC